MKRRESLKDKNVLASTVVREVFSHSFKTKKERDFQFVPPCFQVLSESLISFFPFAYTYLAIVWGQHCPQKWDKSDKTSLSKHLRMSSNGKKGSFGVRLLSMWKFLSINVGKLTVFCLGSTAKKSPSSGTIATRSFKSWLFKDLLYLHGFLDKLTPIADFSHQHNKIHGSNI